MEIITHRALYNVVIFFVKYNYSDKIKKCEIGGRSKIEIISIF